MVSRCTLVLVIGALSGFILIAGLGVAGLAGLTFWRSMIRAPVSVSLLVVTGEQRLNLIADDGSSRVVAENVSPELFHYPSSTPDGRRIAYIGREGNETILFTLDLTSGQRTELYRSQVNPPLYATWSPDGRYISVLANLRGGGLGTYIVAADGTGQVDQLATSPRSSYFAWRPDSGAILLHTGGNPGRVAALTLGQTEPLSERTDPGFFQAPAWSTAGDAFFYVAQPDPGGALTTDRIESVLTRVASSDGSSQVVVREPRAAIIFSRAPTSDDLAYTTVGETGFGALKIVTVGAERARTISRPDEEVVAFFWAPDSSQIAYLTIERRDGQTTGFVWHLVDAGSGNVRDLERFVPSQAFAALINYFDAYALALNLWSPDSQTLVYGSAEGVFTLDVASGAATRQASGVIGLWVHGQP